MGVDSIEEIMKLAAGDARVEYRKAVAAGKPSPVIVLCTDRVYSKLGAGNADGPMVSELADFVEARGLLGVTVVVENHEHLYQGLTRYSPGAAEALGPHPDPARPYRVVVINSKEASVFASDPDPRATPPR